MYLAQVTGAIVSTTKHESLNGNKLLVVTRLDQQHRPTSETEIAIDCVGAGNSDIVVVTTGSSARKSSSHSDSVTDAAIVGIVDSLES
ncbi:EutN/CcmL family microcompartment protein [Vibrio parahaemolyticus]|uniref:EutN/CcmL family microcompartment protein n=1 Tax=Vibrio litoralis TaxID=335972 RepID=UPI0004181445|nr:EutN/CcmL family microcompartment protein [Vibrio litoralis]WMN86181.1 EutN/CcmL family microcompartment protein [Vibrio parahaemolyticus]